MSTADDVSTTIIDDIDESIIKVPADFQIGVPHIFILY